jgi:alkyl hydroperoxide reductase subunit AhpC
MTRRLTVGDKAPDFELPEAYGGSVHLSDLEQSGTAILVFYSGDFGIICSVEMKQLQRMYEEFKQAGAEIIGIATNSLFVHSAWKSHLIRVCPEIRVIRASVADKNVLESPPKPKGFIYFT